MLKLVLNCYGVYVVPFSLIAYMAHRLLSLLQTCNAYVMAILTIPGTGNISSVLIVRSLPY